MLLYVLVHARACLHVRVRACACVLLMSLCARVSTCSQKLSQRIEPLLCSEATSWRDLPAQAYLQASKIAYRLGSELHFPVPFLAGGFVFGLPGSSARMGGAGLGSTMPGNYQTPQITI